MAYRVLISGAVVSILLAGFLGWRMNAPHISRAAVREIKEGMTPEEVQRVIGGPPGLYSTVPEDRFVASLTWPNGEARGCWYVDEGGIEVWYGKDGHVSYVEWMPIVREPTLWQRVRYCYRVNFAF
jgi:hypothetical protein